MVINVNLLNGYFNLVNIIYPYLSKSTLVVLLPSFCIDVFPAIKSSVIRKIFHLLQALSD